MLHERERLWTTLCGLRTASTAPTKYNRTVVELLEAEQQFVEGITLEVVDKTVKKKKNNKIEEAVKQENCKVTTPKRRYKSLGKKFACSSSLSKTDQGQLQGDCRTELLDVMPKMFGVYEDQIVVIDEPIKPAKTTKKGGGSTKLCLRNWTELQHFLCSLHVVDKETSVLLIDGFEYIFADQSMGNVYQTLAFMLEAQDYMKTATGFGVAEVVGNSDAFLL